MFKIVLFMFGMFAHMVACDSIGYNRLRNNLDSHIKIRTQSGRDYAFQIMQFVMENNLDGNELVANLQLKF